LPSFVYRGIAAAGWCVQEKRPGAEEENVVEEPQGTSMVTVTTALFYCLFRLLFRLLMWLESPYSISFF
jgi:hypothetical protein